MNAGFNQGSAECSPRGIFTIVHMYPQVCNISTFWMSSAAPARNKGVGSAWRTATRSRDAVKQSRMFLGKAGPKSTAVGILTDDCV